MTMYMATPSVACRAHLRGWSPGSRRLRQQGEMDHVAVGGGVRGVAGEERGRGGGGLLHDGHVVWRHDLVARDHVGADDAGRVEDDPVTRHELVDVTERVGVGDPVAGEHRVARLARKGRSGPVAGTEVYVAQR